ncbi:MAG: prolipoprotein diacylglyceryl transferase family protein [Candidatus Roizmanbacteria bacterium]
MLPVLLDLKFIKIYTFGVFLVLAFFWALFLLWRNVRLTSHKEEDIFDVTLISLIGAFIIGRAVYVTAHFSDFGWDFAKILFVNGYPGISFFGMLSGGILFFTILLQMRKIKIIETLDYVVGPLLLALAFGKLGSFFAGVEVGTKTTFILALRYVNFDGMRHLTPLYESIIFFLGAYLVQIFLYKIRREHLKKGFAFFFFCWYASIVLFFLDPLKEGTVKIGNINLYMVLSGVVLLTTSIYIVYYYRSSIIKSFPLIKIFSNKNGKSSNKTISNTAGKKTPERKDKDS